MVRTAQLKLNAKALFFSFLCFISCALTGQNNFLQINANGGISKPVGDFSDAHMFANQGYNYGGGIDYFFKKFGLGISGGYIQNDSKTLFEDYIQHKYLETVKNTQSNAWQVKYVLAGPTFKLSAGRFQLDLFAKIGASQITVPELIFTKTFFEQSYDIYKFSGTVDDWQLAWNGGTSLTYKLNKWLGIQARADYFSTQYLSKMEYNYSYRDVKDLNLNGVIDDPEYFDSQRVKHEGDAVLSVLNLNMGLVFQLNGKSKKASAVNPELLSNELAQNETTTNDTVVETPDDKQEVVTPINSDVNKSATKNDVQKPIEIALEDTKVKTTTPSMNESETKVTKQTEDTQKTLEVVDVPATTFDAPDAKYDEEAAEFLYKAGEAYFAVNDFENALPCFNKLKADPKYPRSQYMFALTLCSMGNCNEGKKEYKDFAKTYKESDARTLEVIFASQFEKCGSAYKSNSIKPKNMGEKSDLNVGESNIATTTSTTTMATEYKIQFIAMKKSNADFPRVADVGTIVTEFFPKKSVFRYSIAGYDDIKSAADDLYQVRKLGYRDAFIAVYENGKRVNTIYHQRK